MGIVHGMHACHWDPVCREVLLGLGSKDGWVILLCCGRVRSWAGTVGLAGGMQ